MSFTSSFNLTGVASYYGAQIKSSSSTVEPMANQGRGGYNRGPDDDDEPEDGRGGYN